MGFLDRLSPNAGQKYCRMLQGEHSAIFSTFIKLRFDFKTFVMSIFEWPLKTGFTVHNKILILIILSNKEVLGEAAQMLRLARAFAMSIHKI